jgi:mannonate dehydratase
MGYNFSIAGVAGRTTGPYARGAAPSVGMEGTYDLPMPKGMVWNMIYDENAPEGFLPSISHDELWRRLERFLSEVLPVAEAAGVKLAAHPDDPPTPTVRAQPRLVHQPRHYQKLIDLHASPANTLEFCIGSLAEMTEGDIYETVDTYSRQQRLGYVHFRNITGKVPTYKETFIDDGDVDMLRVIEILKRNKFEGVLIPDHTPAMSCAAPWHAGMAYAMGYMKAAMRAVGAS